MSGVNQGLVAASSRLAKKNLTIPRLEFIAGHMAANLVNTQFVTNRVGKINENDFIVEKREY